MLTPLVSFSSSTALKEAIQNSDLKHTFDERLFEDLLARGLPPLVSPTVFAIILGISPKLITAMGRNPGRYYRRFVIPKRGGGERTILAPRTFLKAVQYYILRFILRDRPISGFATGFVPGKGIVHNARLHAGAPFLLNVDLQDFFGSVRQSQVRQVYGRLGFPPATADALAQLCIFAGSLPQGAPTSPTLSNLVFAEIDEEIARLAARRRLTYSRYADDLSFSGLQPISKEVTSELGRLLSTHGFRLNPTKTRFAGPGQARYVTGLVVNVRAQLDRTGRRKLRAMFHRAEMEPTQFSARAKELMGWASYVKSFDFARGLRYMGIARSLPSD